MSFLLAIILNNTLYENLKFAGTTMLLFDPSMLALPIIASQKALSVGLFTRQLYVSWD